MSEHAVTFNGRTFELNEPSTSTVLSILNVLGSIGVRAEKQAMQVASNPTSRAVLFGFLASMREEDLTNFGIAVLQIGDDKKAQKWLEQNIKVAPLLEAFFENVALSSDLLEALKSFFKGANLLEGVVKAFSGMTTRQQAETETEPAPDTGPSDSSEV